MGVAEALQSMGTAASSTRFRHLRAALIASRVSQTIHGKLQNRFSPRRSRWYVTWYHADATFDASSALHALSHPLTSACRASTAAMIRSFISK